LGQVLKDGQTPVDGTVVHPEAFPSPWLTAQDLAQFGGQRLDAFAFILNGDDDGDFDVLIVQLESTPWRRGLAAVAVGSGKVMLNTIVVPTLLMGTIVRVRRDCQDQVASAEGSFLSS
jgi:hypothetical protein